MGSVAQAFFVAAGVMLAVPRVSGAQEIAHAEDHQEVVPRAEYVDKDVDFVGTLGGALDKAAFAGSVGMRLRFAKNWHVGLHAEYNPYGSVTRLKLRSGSANFFGSIDYRWVKTGRVSLTTIGYLGASWLLFDLVGVPKGSVGPYLGITPLCAEVRLSERISLLVESMRVAIPIPQVSGVPFGYRQYRFSVGVAIALD